MNDHTHAVRSYCTRQQRSGRALPGRCMHCAQRVELVLPYGWRELDGRPHRCPPEPG